MKIIFIIYIYFLINKIDLYNKQFINNKILFK